MVTKTILTDDIKNAIREAAKSKGTLTAFARFSGIKPTTLRMLMGDRAHSMTSATWNKLYPFLQPYLAGGRGSPDIPQRPMMQSDFTGNARTEERPTISANSYSFSICYKINVSGFLNSFICEQICE